MLFTVLQEAKSAAYFYHSTPVCTELFVQYSVQQREASAIKHGGGKVDMLKRGITSRCGLPVASLMVRKLDLAIHM